MWSEGGQKAASQQLEVVCTAHNCNAPLRLYPPPPRLASNAQPLLSEHTLSSLPSIAVPPRALAGGQHFVDAATILVIQCQLEQSHMVLRGEEKGGAGEGRGGGGEGEGGH